MHIHSRAHVFNIQRHLISRRTLRVFRDQAMLMWRYDSRSVNSGACVIRPAIFRLT